MGGEILCSCFLCYLHCLVNRFSLLSILMPGEHLYNTRSCIGVIGINVIKQYKMISYNGYFSFP